MREVVVPVHGGEVRGDLSVPDDPLGIALVVSGAGSRHDPRATRIGRRLRRAGIATVLMDLLTDDEDAADRETGAFRSDAPLLGRRLLGAALWVREQWSLCDLPVGYLGLDEGAAAALWAAAEEPDWVEAVVSIGAPPDLSEPFADRPLPPTLTIDRAAGDRAARWLLDHLSGHHPPTQRPAPTSLGA
jgi:putative phosphoribosyl transferase